MSIFHAIFARENAFHAAQVFLNETLCKTPQQLCIFSTGTSLLLLLDIIDTFSISLLCYSHYDFIQSLTRRRKIVKDWDL